jgi:hypothetical protein
LNFYDFFSETESGIIAYSFQTKTETKYRVFFYPVNQYLELFENYPYMNNKGYFTGITKYGQNENLKEPLDVMLKRTVTKILITFFEDIGSGAVLIYNYDSSDGMHHKRSLCFSRWYEESGYVNRTIKLESTIETYGNGEVIAVDYVGLILLAENEFKDEILNEFHAAKEYLTGNKG